MARRRMFTAELIDSDQFTDMSVQAQMLYINLSVHADDEGFLSSAKRLSMPYGGENSLQELSKAGLIIRFPSGVLVITDWYLQNTIRKDRSTCTNHQTERQMVTIIDGRYVLCEAENNTGNQLTTTCQPNANHLATQNRIEKNILKENIIDHNSIDQTSPECESGENAAAEAPGGHGKEDASMIKKESVAIPDNVPPELVDVCRLYISEKLHINPIEFYNHYEMMGWKDRYGEPIRDWKALARSWHLSTPLGVDNS